jgi:hypothetical protein
VKEGRAQSDASRGSRQLQPSFIHSKLASTTSGCFFFVARAITSSEQPRSPPAADGWAAIVERAPAWGELPC